MANCVEREHWRRSAPLRSFSETHAQSAFGRFYYGQPNYAQMQRRDYRPAWRQWRRGDRLPFYARAHYREVDWRRERLRQPPRSYHYVRDDRGELLLVGIANGVILSILLCN
ncbi:MAG: RcnB family protein [Vitreimonas sp.]